MSFSKVILAAAVAVFIDYPEAEEVYVTEDGNAWLPHVKHLARTHAVGAKLPEPVCVTRSMEHLGEMYEQVANAGKEADRANKAKEEADAESARLAANAAAADAQAEEAAAAEAAAAEAAAAEAAAAEAAAAKDDEAAEKRAQDEADAKAAAEAKATPKQEGTTATSTPKGKGKSGK